MFDNVFPKIVIFFEKISKNMEESERPLISMWWWVACWVIRLHVRKHTPAPMQLHQPPPHTHTHTRTRTRKYVRQCFSTAMDS
jgi:hypothetical protein